jgi:hypothetical protein
MVRRASSALVVSEKQASAFYSLNAVLVLARAMAYRGEACELLAKVLDVAEYLPRLMAEREDRTKDFRDCLLDLTRENADFRLAVDRFDEEAPKCW